MLHDDASARARARRAGTIERLLAEAGARRAPLRGLRSLVAPDVAAAAGPALLEIRAVLLDDALPVSDEAMRRLSAFLTDGASSPLYHAAPAPAERAARELAAAFVLPAVTAGLQAA